ncbi:MAG: pitrilysin family protein [Calditrichia bacterium]
MKTILKSNNIRKVILQHFCFSHLQHVRFILLASVLFSLAAYPLQSQEVSRSEPPQPGPPLTLTLPAVQHFQLSNGVPVTMMQQHKVPLVEIYVIVKAGIVMDTPQKSGLASITASMLDEGAGSRNALQFADAVDFLGADLFARAGFNTTTIALHTPLSKLDSAMVLLSDMVLRPTFPAEELERVRTSLLTTLIQWHDEPRVIASVLLNNELYGEKHPYGRPAIGTEKSIRSFQVADLKNFHSTYFRANNADIVVVGDIDQETIQPKLEKAFGKWESGKIPAPELPPIHAVKKRRIYIVDKAGAPQSEIRIGSIGAPRLTDEYYDLVVLNTILGGSFTSRLNQNLREVHGYTYGAGSRFYFRELPGPFIAASAVQTAVTDSALYQFMYELNGIRMPVPENELDRAKNYVALGFPENFETVSSIANQLSELVFYGLPDNYFNDYIQHILGVTDKGVQQAADKYIIPDKMDVVIVGDRKAIAEKVKALNLGPIKFMTIDQVLGPVPKMNR